jgi:hypothetical protein
LEVLCGACGEAKGRGMVVNELVDDKDIEKGIGFIFGGIASEAKRNGDATDGRCRRVKCLRYTDLPIRGGRDGTVQVRAISEPKRSPSL